MTTKTQRIIYGIISGLITFSVGMLMVYFVFITAPTESLVWLDNNPIIEKLIIFTTISSMGMVGIGAGISLSKHFFEVEE